MIELPPIVAVEKIETGWGGITAEGDILNVTAEGEIPEEVVVSQNSFIAKRRIATTNVISIAHYLELFKSAVFLHQSGKDTEALAAIDDAIMLADTARAQFNRAMILLALGRWKEGFVAYELCERVEPFQRKCALALISAGAKPWRGESLSGKRLLLVHDHGLGDTIMMFRFLPDLALRGADVTMFVPPALTRLASQSGRVTANSLEIAAKDCDYFVSFLQLMK
jgi:hypothetical protein